MSRNRARMSILSHLFSFPTISSKDWTSCMFDDGQMVGDLVAIQSAPDSKYYLSWLRELKTENKWRYYLLESIEDGELCWWHNVGISIYNRELVADIPSWKWDDNQFAFNDRWHKACKRNDAYIVRPLYPIFNGKKVTLNIRIRYDLSRITNPVTFDNWKKLTIKDMEKYYLDSVALYNADIYKKKAKS